jgi:hypothetical protein
MRDLWIRYWCLNGGLPPNWGLWRDILEIDIQPHQESRTVTVNAACGVTGGLPSEWGLNMITIKKLVLPNNKLSGRLPPEVSSLVKLQDLDLMGNRFTGAQSSPCYCHCLRTPTCDACRCLSYCRPL